MEQSSTLVVPSAAVSRAWLRRAGPALLLCGLIVLAYGPAVPNFFVSDDLDMLSGDASDLLSPTSGFGRFMPLAAAIHRGAAVLFGLNPVPAHALQLALHAASALLVYALARKLLAGPGPRHGRDSGASPPGMAGEGDAGMPTTSLAARPGGRNAHGPRLGAPSKDTCAWDGGDATIPALVAALLFAFYPRQHQVVMWFGAVSIGVAAALALATAVLFLHAWRGNDARAGWAAAATYAAALLAHESAVVLPLLLLALAWYDWTAAPRIPTSAGESLTVSLLDRERSGEGPPTAVVAGLAVAAPPEFAVASSTGEPPRARALSRVTDVLQRLPVWAWVMVAASAAHLGLLVWAYRVRAATYPDSGYRFLGLGGDLPAAPLRYAAQFLAPPPWTESLALGAVGLAAGGLALLGVAWWAWRGGALARFGLAWTAIAGAPFVLFGIYGVTDRYYYLPSVGLALAATVALGRTGRWRVLIVAGCTVLGVVLLGQVAAEWRQAGASVRGTMNYLAGWAGQSRTAPPEAVAFVGVPFKRGEQWPASQVYVFSTGLVGAAHLATGWPALHVSYVFADEQPALGAWLAGLPEAPGPRGLALFALDAVPPANRTTVLGSALPELTRLRWRGASRTPIDWARYAGGSPAGDESPR